MFGLLKRKASAKGRIGIAMSGGSLALAIVRRESGGAPILERCESVPLDLHAGPEAVAAALKALNLPDIAISVVLQPTEYQLALVETPDVPPAELRAAMRWRLRDTIDFRVEDAVIDVFDIPPQSRGSQGRMMYAVAARVQAVEKQSAMFAGFSGFDVVDVPELCLRNLAGLLPTAASGLAMLHLGDSTATVVLVRGATFYFARQMNLSTRGAAAAGATLNAESVLLELQRSLDYYERHFDQPPITRVAIAPAGERASALAADLGQDSGFDMSVLDLNVLMQCAAPLDPSTQAACIMAVGAALRQEHRTP